MSIYDQNHNNINYQLTPPDKRSTTMIAWQRCLVKPIQWLHDLFFIDYAKGNNSMQYDAGTGYQVGDRVQWKNQVYEVWNGPPPAGTDPSDSLFILVCADFRGADERVEFSSQVLVFEYLLNQWFRTTFRQPLYVAPPGTPAPKSDIWIEQTAIIDGSFLIRPKDNAISFIRPSGYNFSYIRPNHQFKSVNFIVHYPVSVIPDGSYLYTQLTTLVNRYALGGTVPGYQSY